jgi:hypothetical protein
MTDEDDAANTEQTAGHAMNEEDARESTDPQTSTTGGGDPGAGWPARERRRAPQLSSTLQPADPRPLRDIDHGRTGAMWTAVMIMLPSFLAAGIAMVWADVTVMIICGCVFCVGIIIGIVLREMGYGLYVHKSGGH